MRRYTSLLVIFISLSAGGVSHAADVKRPVLRIVSSRADLEKVCRFSSDLYACTTFEERQLEIGCAGMASIWRMRVRASIQPVVYLWDSSWLSHEKLHLRDIEAALDAYRNALSSRTYETESDCQGAAAADMAGFSRQVDLFAAASNELRHYRYGSRNRAR